MISSAAVSLAGSYRRSVPCLRGVEPIMRKFITKDVEDSTSYLI